VTGRYLTLNSTLDGIQLSPAAKPLPTTRGAMKKCKTQNAKRKTISLWPSVNSLSNSVAKYSSWHFVPSFLRVSILRFHQDTRGAVSVLVLLTIWSLVAILGLVWNTTEQSKRRTEIQTAADSAAHSAATWMARTVNAVDAQNMLICQDASTESIWRAIPPPILASPRASTGTRPRQYHETQR